MGAGAAIQISIIRFQINIHNGNLVSGMRHVEFGFIDLFR